MATRLPAAFLDATAPQSQSPKTSPPRYQFPLHMARMQISGPSSCSGLRARPRAIAEVHSSGIPSKASLIELFVLNHQLIHRELAHGAFACRCAEAICKPAALQEAYD